MFCRRFLLVLSFFQCFVLFIAMKWGCGDTEGQRGARGPLSSPSLDAMPGVSSGTCCVSGYSVRKGVPSGGQALNLGGGWSRGCWSGARRLPSPSLKGQAGRQAEPLQLGQLCDPMDLVLRPWGSPGEDTGWVAMPFSRGSPRRDNLAQLGGWDTTGRSCHLPRG